MELVQSVDAFADLYRSIDVRVIAYLKDSVWNASHVVIRFRLESVDDVQNQQNAVLQKYGRITNDEFKIVFEALDFNDWETIKQNWRNNIIVVNEERINLKPTDIFRYNIDEPRSHDNLDFVNRNWYSYHEHFSLNLQECISKLRDMSSQAISNDHRNMADYLSKILETSTYQIESGMIMLTVPIIFKIENVVFDENHVKIKCTGPQSEITGNFTIYEKQSHSGMRGQTKFQYPLSSFDIPSLRIWDFVAERNIDPIDPDDEYEIIITRNSVIVARETGIPRLNWPSLSRIVNPTLSIFEKFVPMDDLKSALLNPQRKRINNIGTFGPEKIFERGVTWLLNLLDISTIHFQEYDQSGEGVNRISLDVVGKFENKIILCHPTIATNLEEVMDTSRNVKENLSRDLSEGLEIKSVVFTPKSIQSQRNSNTDDNTILLGKEELTTIIEHLESGNIDEARKMVLGTNDSL